MRKSGFICGLAFFLTAFFASLYFTPNPQKLIIEPVKPNLQTQKLHEDCYDAVIKCTAADYLKFVENRNELIELNPNDAENYFERGSFYHRLEEYDKAIADFNKAIELNPQNYYYYFGRAMTYGQQDKPALAIADYKSGLKLNPESMAAYSNRGREYFVSGFYKEAIADYTNALRYSEHEFSGTYVFRGEAYFMNGNYQLAMKDYNKAIYLNPNIADAFRGRAETYKKFGQKKKAEADRKKYEELKAEESKRQGF